MTERVSAFEEYWARLSINWEPEWHAVIRGITYDAWLAAQTHAVDTMGAEREELKAENAMLHERCSPSKVVSFAGAGHYVSLAVYDYIERLKAESAKAVFQKNDIPEMVRDWLSVEPIATEGTVTYPTIPMRHEEE
jgi:hypothetical protein